MHHTPLIATILAGLTIAFVLGAVAHRLKLSPLIGYLLAGVLVGPFTPGYVADQSIANELAEIGVILLMFGVGLHFSLKDLLAVRNIAIPGALVQMTVATLLGMALGWALGWPPVAGLVFGLALSVASTVVLLRALQERRIVQTERGRIAVGWLIVEDLAMVMALVLLPALAGALVTADHAPGLWDGFVMPLALTLGKVAAFIAVMLVVGRRVIPWVLHYVAHTGSRELFRLAVLAIALGVAFGASSLFGVSFALGAFFAGMILAESELSQRAAEETLPLRDAFAVLFFVSVGMLFNPMVVVENPWPLLATVGIIVVGKSLAAFAIVRAFKHENTTALTISASLAQIGEFSFILASLGVALKLLPKEGSDLILAGAIISILLNPLLFRLALGGGRPAAKLARDGLPTPANEPEPTALSGHVIVVGYGRVGAAIGDALESADLPFLIVEADELSQRRARDAGLEVIDGNAADPQVLSAAGIAVARKVMIAVPDGYEAGGVVQEARRCNPGVEIIARAHSDAEIEHLMRLGADQTVLGERELAAAMLNPAKSAEAVSDRPPSEPRPTPLPGGHLVLTDPQWALLAGVRDDQIGPGQTVSKQALFGHADKYGAFDTSRLEEALRALVAQGLVTELGDGRVRLSRSGYLASVQAPKA